MAESYTKLVNLPPGWDVKYDTSTGKCYYINYLTKVMQLEDPRVRYKQLQNERCSTESIPMQPLHGSPYHVYPTNNFPAVKAFQGPNPSLQNISASPLLSTRSQLSSAMEMSPIFRAQNHLQGSPQNPRTGSLSRRQSIQETSFTNQIDTDLVVSKIQNMFPTAGENHIRLLLKKYYNREAVVISALQVEKHPVTMPGPFATPPSQRHLFHNNTPFHMTPPTRRLDFMYHSSRTGSPIPGRPGSISSSCIGGLLYGSPRIGEQIRNSPKPHSSPKMKLRYMKNIFPKADEELLLDILANSDNNVQKASEKLLAMGYTKRDVGSAPKLSNREEEQKRRERVAAAEKLIPLHPKELTDEEKNQIKERLKIRYKKIAERIILMALESVNYSEDRATQILQIVQQEDESRAKKDAENEINRTAIENSIVEENITLNDSNVRENAADPVITNDTIVVTVVDSDYPQTQLKSSLSQQPPNSPNSSTTITTVTTSKRAQEKLPITLPDEIQINFNSLSVGNLAEPKNLKYTKQQKEQKNQQHRNLGNNDGLFSNSSNKLTPSKSSFDKPSPSPSSSDRLRFRDKSDSLKNSPKGSTKDENDNVQVEFQSILGRIATLGHDNEMAHGPDDTLLLADYITWNGANPDIAIGNNKSVSNGSDGNLLGDRSASYTAHGRNSELCKGPKIGLAKGSIYAQLAASNNIKCN